MHKFATGLLLSSVLILALCASPARADGNLAKVMHVVVIMQENHSFDDYLGVLPYSTNTPYHSGPCADGDHSCVDGLTCSVQNESLTCSNSNPDPTDTPVTSFHDPDYCGVDLDHGFTGVHKQLNFSNPTDTLASSPMDGFVKDSGNRAMAHYDETDIPFYYSLAETFAIDDRYFASVLGPTFPNRTAELTATTFGHITSDEGMPPVPAGYRPITRTIFDLLDASRVTWADYFSDQAYAQVFRPIPTPHIRTLVQFMRDAKRGTLPSVSFVDPGFNP